MKRVRVARRAAGAKGRRRWVCWGSAVVGRGGARAGVGVTGHAQFGAAERVSGVAEGLGFSPSKAAAVDGNASTGRVVWSRAGAESMKGVVVGAGEVARAGQSRRALEARARSQSIVYASAIDSDGAGMPGGLSVAALTALASLRLR